MSSKNFCKTTRSAANGAIFAATALLIGCAGSSTAAEHYQAQIAAISGLKSAMPSTASKPSATTRTPSPKTTLASNIKRCETSQLSVLRINSDAGVGNIGVTYAFTNTSSSTCTLYGYPGFDLLDANSQPLQGVRVIRSESTYFNSSPPHKRVTLAPGDRASFQIGYHNRTGYPNQSCPTSVKIEITPPNAYHHFTLKEHIQPCGGKVRVTPVRAGVQ